MNQPVVAGTLLGDAPRDGYVSSGGGRPGDAVLMAGSAPVEGTSIIAREKREALLADGWSRGELDEAAAYLHVPGISVLVPALAAVRSRPRDGHARPDRGRRGTGLAELAYASGCGLEVDLDAIHVPELSRRLCAHFGLDPLGVIASGALLAVAPPAYADDVMAVWRERGWSAHCIGRLVEGDGLAAYAGGERAAVSHVCSG